MKCKGESIEIKSENIEQIEKKCKKVNHSYYEDLKFILINFEWKSIKSDTPCMVEPEFSVNFLAISIYGFVWPRVQVWILYPRFKIFQTVPKPISIGLIVEDQQILINFWDSGANMLFGGLILQKWKLLTKKSLHFWKRSWLSETGIPKMVTFDHFQS